MEKNLDITLIDCVFLNFKVIGQYTINIPKIVQVFTLLRRSSKEPFEKNEQEVIMYQVHVGTPFFSFE